MTDEDVLATINKLVAEEHDLRRRHAAGELTDADEQARLAAAEVQLDQAWDLLRQRRALRETGGDPNEARERPAEEVEGYLG